MSLGPWQVFLILVIILVLFGAGKLPQVMGDLGKGLRNLRGELKDGKLAATTEDKPNH
ncbi:twin-arginine translocase TatA/TatE family subunit [Candidatus Anaplasma sp. TIGMIC]|uniref:twin-arginine translocase TatA n=1 Tax=Candidatus Anaplasma sp. TIGMIC TaxID=3020713 RepID=UPI002331051B|nr:twin-arginine translocase TatA/TatE family subunit [Candidatus Anaplasma sp. TIGMIC]MDB1135108.1 twin-arginine translocase TatA/TatE family subunit [Candidatus Anaplasma sp. TIGMIC]